MLCCIHDEDRENPSSPDPAESAGPGLTERVTGTDQSGAATAINVPVERPLTLYLNAQEIVTMMTIGDLSLIHI